MVAALPSALVTDFQSALTLYLVAYEDGWDAEIGQARFLWRYCHVRPHRSLGGRTPYLVYTETATDPSGSELAITDSALVQ
jgi:putative transposase